MQKNFQSLKGTDIACDKKKQRVEQNMPLLYAYI